MGTVQNIQSSFSEGRISPRLHGQIDIPSYKTSLKTLENFIVLPQGSVARRPGTYYVSEASTTTDYQSKLVPFYYGQGQSYVLEFYADNIKIFYNNGILGLQSNNATQFTIASTGYTATEIADIKYIQSADVIFLAHPNHPPKKIERTVPNLNDTGYKSAQITTVTHATNLFTSAGHGLSNGDAVTITAPSGFPTGLVADTLYYVISATTDTFKLSAISGGSEIGISSNGSGTISWIHDLRAEDGSYWAISNIDFVDGPYDELNKVDASLFKIERGSGSISGINTSTNIITSTAHGLENGDLVEFTATTLPTNIEAGINYYVISKTTDTFKISTSQDGGVFSIDSTGNTVVWNRSYDMVEIGGVGVDTALDAFVNSSHGLQAGMKVYFHKDGITSGGVGNLVTDDAGTPFAYFTSSDNATATSQGNSTTYYVVNPTATTFQITDEISSDGVLGTPITFKLSGNNTKWTGKINVVKKILKKDRTRVTLKAHGHTPFTTGGSSPDIGVIYRVNVLAGEDREKIKRNSVDIYKNNICSRYKYHFRNSSRRLCIG